MVVPPEMRGERRAIAFALRAAHALFLSKSEAPTKSIRVRMPVHALVMPSIVPLDLAVCFRSQILQELVSPVPIQCTAREYAKFGKQSEWLCYAGHHEYHGVRDGPGSSLEQGVQFASNCK